MTCSLILVIRQKFWSPRATGWPLFRTLTVYMHGRRAQSSATFWVIRKNISLTDLQRKLSHLYVSLISFIPPYMIPFLIQWQHEQINKVYNSGPFFHENLELGPSSIKTWSWLPIFPCIHMDTFEKRIWRIKYWKFCIYRWRTVAYQINWWI